MRQSNVFSRSDHWSFSNDEELDRTAELTRQILEDFRQADQVERAISATGHKTLRSVKVTVCDGQVRLQGVVPSRDLMWIAWSAAHSVAGVQYIRNDLIAAPTE